MKYRRFFIPLLALETVAAIAAMLAIYQTIPLAYGKLTITIMIWARVGLQCINSATTKELLNDYKHEADEWERLANMALSMNNDFVASIVHAKIPRCQHCESTAGYDFNRYGDYECTCKRCFKAIECDFLHWTKQLQATPTNEH